MSEPVTIEKRMELGKKGELWRIEVLCKRPVDQDVKRISLDNQTNAELMNFRGQIFTHGIMYALDPGHWVIIPPWDLVEFNVWRQKTFFSK
jgi:hypothetical protein